MAVNAKFLADFTTFERAVEKAEVTLRDFSKAALTVDRDLARVGNSFTGQKIIQEATLAAKAVEAIGGATKLTESEQRRLAGTVDEAIAKFRALGQDVPAGIAKLHQSLQPIPKELTLMQKGAEVARSSFGQMFGAFSVATLVTNALQSAGRAVVALGKEAVESAGHIVDLSKKTGLTTDTIQEMQHVAAQTGGSLDAFSQSAFQLGARISGGSGSVQAAVATLGLSFQDIERMRPDEQFNRIVAALGNVGVEQDRNALGMQLFGKTFTGIAAAVAEGYKEIADGAAKSTQQQLDAIDRAADRWQQFYDQQKKNVQGFLGDLVTAGEEFNKLSLFQKVGAFALGGPADVARALAESAKARTQSAAAGDEQPGAPSSAAIQDYVVALKAARAEVDELTGAQRSQIIAAKQLGIDTDVLTAKFGISEAAIGMVTEANKKATKSTTDYNKEIADLAKQLSGQGVVAQARKYVDAIDDIHGVSKLAEDQIRNVNQAMTAAIKIMGKDAPQAFRDLKRDTDRSIVSTIDLKYWMDETGKSALRERENIALLGEGIVGLEKNMRSAMDSKGLQEFFDGTRAAADNARLLAASGDVAKATTQGFADHFKEGLADVPGIIAQAAANGGSLADAADAVGSLLGAAVGKSIGASIGGPIGGKVGEALGAVAGSLVSEVVDAFTVSAGEDVARRVGRRIGISITEEMGDAIAETARQRFGGDREAAEIFHIGDLLATVEEGLNDSNFDEFLGRFRDVFVQIGNGVFETSEAVHVLDQNFATFAEHATANGRLASAAFLEIIDLAEQAGLRVGAIDAFVTEQASSAVTGIEAVVGPAAEAMKEMAKQQAELDRLRGSGGSAEQISVVTRAIQEQQQIIEATGIKTEAAAAGIGAALFSAFAELTERGTSPADAIEQLAPAIDAFQTQLLAAGLTGGAAFAEIQRMAAVASDTVAGPALDAIHGAAQALTGLHNAGILNQEMFTGLSSQAAETFNTIVAQGTDSSAALALIAPDLQRIFELQEDFGYVVDASTQALLDQAVEAGAVGDAHRDAQQQAVTAMQEAADAMEEVAGVLREVFGVAGDEGEAFADRVNAAIASIQTDLEFTFRGQVIPPGGSGLDPIPMGAGGSGRVTQPTLFLAGERGPEDFWFGGSNRSGGLTDVSGIEGRLDTLNARMVGMEGAMRRRDQRTAIEVENVVLTRPR